MNGVEVSPPGVDGQTATSAGQAADCPLAMGQRIIGFSSSAACHDRRNPSRYPAEVDAIAALARVIWQDAYAAIITQAQIDYMLEQRYNARASAKS